MTTPKRRMRRRQILQAAEQVFNEHGYAEATIDEVAERAGLAKGTIYNYYRSKEALFNAIFNDVITEAEAEANRRLSAHAPAAERLTSLLDFWFDRLSRHHQLGRLFLEFWATAARKNEGGELNENFRQTSQRFRQKLAAVLAEGAANGEFRTPIDTTAGASLIMAVLDGIELQSILNVGIESDDTFLDSLKRGVLAALSNGRDTTPQAGLSS